MTVIPIAEIITLCAGIVSGYFFAALWWLTTRGIGHWAYGRGFHFHHSLFGLLAFAVIPLVWGDLDKVLLLFGFGSGVIVEHTIREGFWFITRD